MIPASRPGKAKVRLGGTAPNRRRHGARARAGPDPDHANGRHWSEWTIGNLIPREKNCRYLRFEFRTHPVFRCLEGSLIRVEPPSAPGQLFACSCGAWVGISAALVARISIRRVPRCSWRQPCRYSPPLHETQGRSSDDHGRDSLGKGLDPRSRSGEVGWHTGKTGGLGWVIQTNRTPTVG